jgi:hypothetical protein
MSDSKKNRKERKKPLRIEGGRTSILLILKLFFERKKLMNNKNKKIVKKPLIKP